MSHSQYKQELREELVSVLNPVNIDDIFKCLHRTMRTSGRATLCCAALLLALTSVSALQRLNSIKDLKKIQSTPEEMLVLLYWFATTVEISRNNQIWLPFDPNNDYGSHHYGNYQRVLDPLSHGHRYYTVGNINEDSSVELPSYVHDHMSERNSARIIFEVTGSNTGQRIVRVFVTEHYEPRQTYEVSTNLLRQIREFSVEDNHTNLRDRYSRNTHDFEINDNTESWGDFAGLGLLLLFVTQKKYPSYQQNRPQAAARENTPSDFVSIYIPSVPKNEHIPQGSDSKCIVWSVVGAIVFVLLVLCFIYIFFQK